MLTAQARPSWRGCELQYMSSGQRKGHGMHAPSSSRTQNRNRSTPHLVRSGSAALEAEGWAVSVSDLYAMGFDPCERPEHYSDRAAAARFDAQVEQRHASENGDLPRA